MRPAAALLAAALAATLLLANAALPAPAPGKPASEPGKRAKRATDRCAKQTRCARLRHQTVRRSVSERLVDATAPGGGSPGPGPGQPTDPTAPGPDAPPRFVSVAAREFSLTLSRPLVSSGDVRVELRNVGEDPHNLVVSPEGTHNPLATWPELDPGAYERQIVPLDPGRYLLWCSLEFHEAQGMSVTLRVE